MSASHASRSATSGSLALVEAILRDQLPPIPAEKSGRAGDEGVATPIQNDPLAFPDGLHVVTPRQSEALFRLPLHLEVFQSLAGQLSVDPRTTMFT